MQDKFINQAGIKVIYFDSEDVKYQETIFDGNVSAWREEVGADFNGYDQGDRFKLNEDTIRVYKLIISKDVDGSISNAIYYVAPNGLNGAEIKFGKIKH